MNALKFSLLLSVLFLLSSPAKAQEDANAPPAVQEEEAGTSSAAEKEKKDSELVLVDTGAIKEILKPDIILLDNDKRYKLDNIRIPAYENEPVMNVMKEAFLGKTVNIYTYHTPDTAIDRYGLPLAHVIRDDGVWIQDYLISKGLAWEFSTETSRKMTVELKKSEDDARGQNLGLWSNPEYTMKTPSEVGKYINSFQVVQGRVLSIAMKDDVVYLNFGKDWRDDFTVELPREYVRSFILDQGGSFNPNTSWQGHTVRIRGWVTEKHGPMITLTHPEQIDVIK